MANTIKLTERALSELYDLPSEVRQQIRLKFDALKIDPHPPGSKKMIDETHEDHPVYRIKSGKYRVLYITPPRQPPIVLIIRLGDRKDVYRKCRGRKRASLLVQP